MALVRGFQFPKGPESWEELSAYVRNKERRIELSVPEALQLYRSALHIADPDSFHFPNLAGKDEISNEAATIRGAGADEYEVLFCMYLTIRNSLFGNSVMPRQYADLAEEAGRLFHQIGLFRDAARGEQIFVNDIFNYPEALKEIAEIARSRNTQISLYPYQQSSAFAELVAEHGLGIIGPNQEGLKAIDNARNKTKFRDFAAEYPDLDLNPYPRVSLVKGDNLKSLEFRSRLRESIAYSLEYLKSGNGSGGSAVADVMGKGFKVLFVQMVEGAGGLGNFIVRAKADSGVEWFNSYDLLSEGASVSELDSLAYEVVTPEKETILLEDIEQLEQWLIEKLADSDIELAPFLDIRYSFSIASVVGENACALVGRLQQLDDKNAYEGYLAPVSRANDPEFMRHYNNALEFQLYFSARLRWHQFFTPDGRPLTQGIDFAVIRQPRSNQEALIAVECNCRPQAPQPTELLVLNMRTWRERIEANELALLGMDHLPCPSGYENPTSLFEYLTERGFPMSTYDSPIGLTIISAEKGESIGLFTGSNDEQVRLLLQWYRMLAGID